LVGSEMVYQLLPEIRRRLPSLRIVDQLFRGLGHLESNRRFAGSIDLTVVPSEQVRALVLLRRSDAGDRVKVILPAGAGAGQPEADRRRMRQEYVQALFPDGGPARSLATARQEAAAPVDDGAGMG